MHRLTLIAILALAVAVLAGCGSKDTSSSGDTSSLAQGTTAADNTIWEHAYSECASTDLDGLSGKYQVANPTIANVTRAVGAAWSDRFNGGKHGTEIGAEGCRDGINSRPDSPSSA